MSTPSTLHSSEVPGHPDFRPLAHVPHIAVDLRYAGSNNFVGRDLYSPHDCAWLHRHAAEALAQAAQWLAAERPDTTLIVLDALRPQHVQQQLWDALADGDLRMYLARPERGSIHSFGMAVDVTLRHRTDGELDMGTPFDDMSERSHPAREHELLVRGALSRQHVANRGLLRAAMRHGGWIGIATEWWHFDCGDSGMIRQCYPRIL